MLTQSSLFATSWTVAHQASQSMGFSRQEYWSGLPFLPPGDLPDAETEPVSPVSLALASRYFTMEPPGKPVIYMFMHVHVYVYINTCIHLFVHLCVHIYTHREKYKYIYIDTYVYMQAQRNISLYIFIYHICRM